ncbi:MAG: PorT family protein [Cryomorphaceae bacterium]|nr:PorT family protein [Cryomorphaceae bacterium]
MRKIFGIAFILSILTFTSAAQFIYVGGGVNGYFINNPDGGSEFDASSFMRRGFQFGADVMLGGRLYFRPGLHFVGTETNLEYTANDGGQVSGTANFSHFRIPLLGGFKILDNSTLGAFVQTGPSGMAVLTVSESEVIEKIMDNDYRTLQWGWAFGVGVRIRFVEASLSYDTGISRTFKTEEANRSRYGLLQLSLGVVF